MMAVLDFIEDVDIKGYTVCPGPLWYERMRFEVDSAKLHHRVISEALQKG